MNEQQKELLVTKREKLFKKQQTHNRVSWIGLGITLVGIVTLLFGIGLIFLVVGLPTLFYNGYKANKCKKEIEDIDFKLVGEGDYLIGK